MEVGGTSKLQHCWERPEYEKSPGDLLSLKLHWKTISIRCCFQLFLSDINNFYSNRILCIYLFSPSTTNRMQHKAIFLSGIQLIWIQSFQSPKPVAIARCLSSVCPQLGQSWVGKSWIHTFPKGISMKENTNNHLQDLNSNYVCCDDNH